MALNDLIAQGAQFNIPNQLEQYARMQQLQTGMNQNALAQYQLSSAKRADTLNEGMLNYMRSPDYTPQGLLQFGTPGIAALKATTEAQNAGLTGQKTQQEIAKFKQDHIAQAQRDLANNPSDANITANNEDFQMSPLYTPQEKAVINAKAQSFLAMPLDQRRMALAGQGGTSADQLKSIEMVQPKTTFVNAGGSSVPVQTNSLAPGYTPPVAIDHTVTPDAVLRSDTLKRGQNMLDSRARDRLDQETATGTLTPESIELAAQLVSQGAPNPITGMGKSAAGMRAQVLNRAAEIGSSGGASAQDAASNIIAGKQNIAAQSSTLKDFSSGVSSRKTTSISTALNHLDTVDKLADAVNNGDFKAFNAVANTLGTQVGVTAPGNLETAAGIVGAEVIKAIVANGGSAAERDAAKNTFNSIKSPQALKEAANVYRDLLGGQLTTLSQQYETGTGRKDFNKKLSPAAVTLLNKVTPAAVPSASGGWGKAVAE